MTVEHYRLTSAMALNVPVVARISGSILPDARMGSKSTVEVTIEYCANVRWAERVWSPNKLSPNRRVEQDLRCTSGGQRIALSGLGLAGVCPFRLTETGGAAVFITAKSRLLWSVNPRSGIPPP